MRRLRIALILGLGGAFGLTGCGAFNTDRPAEGAVVDADSPGGAVVQGAVEEERSTIWDLFRARGDQGQVGEVNRYIWNAALETLDFLPIQTIDPFTGVIVTGYGTPPGGGRDYRATVLVSDPALDGRSLNVALQTRSGPVSADTVRAVENAILTRARQLRQRDSRF